MTVTHSKTFTIYTILYTIKHLGYVILRDVSLKKVSVLGWEYNLFILLMPLCV